MKKNPLLHPEISKVIAGIGKGERLVIASANLPIDSDMKRIDLALTPGIPTILHVLNTVMSEFNAVEATIAEELEEMEFPFRQDLVDELGDIPITQVLYVALKQQTKLAKAVIRTGDTNEYGTVILVAGGLHAN